MQTREGLRALSKDRPIEPERVERYLRGKFGRRFNEAKQAMESLARPLASHHLAQHAYHLYEQFRPAIPAGAGGWGAAGEFDLAAMERLIGARD